MVLTAGELAQARADAATLLPESCVISTPGARTFAEGGWSDGTPTTVTVACRIGPLSAREAVIGGELTTQTDAVITLPAGTSVPSGATITLNGRVYAVVGVRVRSEELTRRVFVRETGTA